MPLPTIPSGNVGSATASTTFNVANSCRFNDGDSASMTKTPSSNGSARIFTWSGWIKRGQISTLQGIWAAGTASNDAFDLHFGSDDLLKIDMYDAGNGVAYNVRSVRVFRDPSAWYHVVVAVDTEQGTEANRYKIYVNGSQITLTEASTGYPAEDYDIPINQTNTPITIGIGKQYSSQYYDGYLAEVVFLDGTAASPTSFGEFDEDSPTIWKPIDVSGLTFGTNGFYLDFEASDNLGNDANGGTDLTEANLAAADSSTDTPTNNFCTMNPLENFYPVATFSEGNNTLLTQASAYSANTGTVRLTAGKWYWEVRFDTRSGSDWMSGITGRTHTGSSYLGSGTQDYGFIYNGGVYHNGSNTTSGYDALAADGTGILGVYLDLDNGKLYFGADGTIQNSGTGISLVALSTLDHGSWTPAFGDGGSGTATGSFNFGNGSFGSSAVASANADANGYGSFEFDPSDGGGSSFDSAAKDFLAICTKNLGSDGG